MCAHAPIWAIWYAESIVSFRAETAAVSNRRGRFVFFPSSSKALINSYRQARNKKQLQLVHDCFSFKH